MDLRSIINSESGGSTKQAGGQAASASSQNQPGPQPPRREFVSPSIPSQDIGTVRPAPPPLQTVVQSPSQSPGRYPSQASAAQHPYGRSPQSTISAHQYPFPVYQHSQSPAQGPQPPGPGHYHERWSAGSPVVGHSQHLYSQSSQPTHALPSAHPDASRAYGSYPQPQSAQSTPTPGSTHSQYGVPNRGSPGASTSPERTHHPSHVSYHSLPTTPLGPPSMPSRTSTGYHREQSSPYATLQRRASGSRVNTQLSYPPAPTSPPNAVRESPRQSAHIQAPVHTPDSAPGKTSSTYLTLQERERSISVSPKTKLPSQEQHERQLSQGAQSLVTPAKRKYSDDEPEQMAAVERSRRPEPPQLAGSDATMNHVSQQARPSTEMQAQEDSRDVAVRQKSHETITPVSSVDKRHSSELDGDRRLPSRPSELLAASPIDNRSSPAVREASVTSAGEAKLSSPSQLRQKRIRYTEPPIFARKPGQTSFTSPLGVVRRFTTSGTPAAVRAASKEATPPVATENGTKSTSADVNGGSAKSPSHSVPQGQPEFADDGPLGRWEPSINNLTPYEEMTRVVADFLFLQVVERTDVGTATAGSTPHQGGQLEIEAKLGQIIDKNTNERLKIPVMTESIFNNDNPSMRTMFKSSMTEAQHRSLNQFLNQTVIKSQPPKQPPSRPGEKPRNTVSYLHTRERDRFFELPPEILMSLPLPPSVRPFINPRHRLSLRITTDQRTGATLAKIIKIRLADLDVYSPRTPFDWRLSVNMEFTYMGDTDGLTEVAEGGKKLDRNKDRMTYKHQACQIDLTQVTTQPDPARLEKEHELEVELSAEKVRDQGQLAKSGRPTQYEDLVKGFVDNVRILARAASA